MSFIKVRKVPNPAGYFIILEDKDGHANMPLYLLQIKRLFISVGKYMLLYSDKATYTFPPSVNQEKLARRVPTVAFSVWSVGPEGRKSPATVFLFEIPGCFAGPIEGSQSDRLSSMWKKDERHRPRVFLNFCENHEERRKGKRK